MALIGNYSLLNKSFARPIGGTVASGNRSAWNQTGGMRNWGKQEGLNWNLAALPQGHGPGGARMLPKTAGGMTARREARIAVGSVANAVMGFPITALASFSINAQDAFGQLISSGTGSASFSITTSPLLLTASIGGTGSASFALTSNTPILGAKADGYGSASMSFSGAANILPLNDASPLRTASASFSITGTLVPYAKGYMIGTTADLGLTVAGITNAVWGSPLAGFTEPGTAGKALAAASSGGVDYEALGMAVWSSVARTLTSSSGDVPTTAEIAAAVVAAIGDTGGSGGTAPSAVLVAKAVRTELASELSKLDARVSTRQEQGTVPANMISINGRPLKGAGTKTDPWVAA